MAKKNWIFIKRGLSEDAKHRERMGVFIWLFLHIIDRADWEEGIAYDWKDKDEAIDMDMPLVTLRYQRRKLEELGYITCKQRQAKQEITIHNWVNPRNYSGKSLNPKGGNDLTPSDFDGDNHGDNHPYAAVNTLTLDSKIKSQAAQKPAPPDSLFPIVEAISRVCRMDIKANKGKLFKESQALMKATPTPTPELIEQNYNGNSAAFWRAHDWRGQKGEPPTPAAIRQTWGQWANYSSAPAVKMFDHAAYPPNEVSADDRAAALAVLNKRLGK